MTLLNGRNMESWQSNSNSTEHFIEQCRLLFEKKRQIPFKYVHKAFAQIFALQASPVKYSILTRQWHRLIAYWKGLMWRDRNGSYHTILADDIICCSSVTLIYSIFTYTHLTRNVWGITTFDVQLLELGRMLTAMNENIGLGSFKIYMLWKLCFVKYF